MPPPMSQKIKTPSAAGKKSARETNASILRKAMLRRLPRRLSTRADVSIAPVPGLLEHYVQMFNTIWTSLGRVFTEPELDQFRGVLKRKLEQAYEALVRSPSPTLPNPPAVLEAGERLGRMNELGRVIRERVARVMPSVPSNQIVFVNLHPLEIADEELISPEAPLSAHASRVVLEVTERARLDDVSDLDERIRALRSLGYRLAVDDLGAGYAGLTSFVRLNPEFVKIDMTLTRDLHRSETKRVLVRSALDLCREMSIRAIVEGVETKDELRALLGIGADLLQGYLFGRPGEALRPVGSESFDV